MGSALVSGYKRACIEFKSFIAVVKLERKRLCRERREIAQYSMIILEIGWMIRLSVCIDIAPGCARDVVKLT